MKRFALISLVLLLCCGIGYAVAELEEGHIIFTANVPTDKDSVCMVFQTKSTDTECFIGYHEYHRPCIPADTKGEIFIPDSVTAPDGRRLPIHWISRGAFQGCSEITKLHLPRLIESISDLAFQNCASLREITLSDSLNVIYPQAFVDCNALQRIVLRCPHPPYTYSFSSRHSGFSEESLSTTTIVFPPTAGRAYESNNIFKSFHFHANLLPTYPEQQQ